MASHSLCMNVTLPPLVSMALYNPASVSPHSLCVLPTCYCPSAHRDIPSPRSSAGRQDQVFELQSMRYECKWPTSPLASAPKCPKSFFFLLLAACRGYNGPLQGDLRGQQGAWVLNNWAKDHPPNAWWILTRRRNKPVLSEITEIWARVL